MPRKLSVASAITMKPTPIEARTMRGGTMFGRTWRSRMVSGRVPLTMAASTNSSVRSASVSDRVSRAIPGHQTIASATITVRVPGPSIAATTIARISSGNAKTTSAPRIRSASTQPPK